MRFKRAETLVNRTQRKVTEAVEIVLLYLELIADIDLVVISTTREHFIKATKGTLITTLHNHYETRNIT